MISVGIDVSKGKSTVCILKPYGEIVSKPFNITHTQKDLSELSSMLFRLNDEVKIVMEATGIYHLPVLTYLQEKGFFVSVINPYLMKSYRNESLRKAKTDKIDSRIIANYGIDHWFKMKEFQTSGEIYEELKLLGQQYRHYMKLHLLSLAELTHLLDLTMPGIKNLLASWNETNRKDKRSDFVERFWHYDVITSMSEQEFTEEYILWAKEKKYVPSQEKAKVIYTLAQESIPTLPSETSSVKMLVTEAAVGRKVVQDGRLVLSLVEDDGGGGEILRGLHPASALRARRGGRSVLAYGARDGDAHLALYPKGRHQDPGVDGFLPDHLHVCRSHPHHLSGGGCPGHDACGSHPGDSPRQSFAHLRLRRLGVEAEFLETVSERRVRGHRDDGTGSGHDAEESYLQVAAGGAEGCVHLWFRLCARQSALSESGCAADDAGAEAGRGAA